MKTEQSCLDKLLCEIEKITFDKIPPKTVAKAKECIADFIGVAFKGGQTQLGRKLQEVEAAPFGSSDEDTALWLGSIGRMPDIDDGHRFAMAHPGVAINSTGLVMARSMGNVSGKELIEAVVKGYEVYCYLGRVINPSAYLKRGIDATGVCGAAAAAATVGSLKKFNHQQMADAISLAASIAGGLNQSAIDGSAQKYLVAGWAAKNGIAAAKLAEQGLGGPSHVFEGRLGFVNAFSPQPDENLLYHPTLSWDIDNVYIKRYSCVRRIHATLDAVSRLVRDHQLSTEQVESVQVFGSQFLCDAVNYVPKDSAQGQTSVPYVVAILLMDGEVEDELITKHLNDPDLLAFAHKITVTKDPEIVAMAEKDKSLWGAAKVEIQMNDGTRYETKQVVPYGDPELAFPPGTVRDKFLRYVCEGSDSEYAMQLWQQLIRLDSLEDVDPLLNGVFTALSKGLIDRWGLGNSL